jgi:hypothetical protein
MYHIYIYICVCALVWATHTQCQTHTHTHAHFFNSCKTSAPMRKYIFSENHGAICYSACTNVGDWGRRQSCSLMFIGQFAAISVRRCPHRLYSWAGKPIRTVTTWHDGPEHNGPYLPPTSTTAWNIVNVTFHVSGRRLTEHVIRRISARHVLSLKQKATIKETHHTVNRCYV